MSRRGDGPPAGGASAPKGARGGRPLRVALLGTRGIPASYGGFETALEYVGPWLAEHGYSVVVYCRRGNSAARGVYRGCRLVTLPTIHSKNLDTIVHSLLSTVHALLRRRPDVAIFFGPGNAPFAMAMRRAGVPTAVNVDGHDWMRRKWGPLARAYLRWGEGLARHADRVIADARVIADDYMRDHGTECAVIPYGAEPRLEPPGALMAELGLERGGYFLYVGRLEPENNAHVLVEAFASLDTDKKLVVVGDVPYHSPYARGLKAMAGPGVLMPGFVYGRGYWELGSNAFAYVQPSEVGGTHPALVEAMGRANPVIVNGTPENLEVMGEAGIAYEPDSGAGGLARAMQRLLADPELVARLGAAAAERARRHYAWEAVCRAYREVIDGLAASKGPGDARSS